MSKSIVCTLLALGFAILTSPQSALAQDLPEREPRIAIGSFAYKGVDHLRDGTAPLVDMISTALIKTRQFKLVERSRVDEALAEMGLGEAGVVDPADCQRLGTLVKADFILFGTITEASLESRDVILPDLSTVKETMRMAVDIRIIDAETGQVMTAETVDAEEMRTKGVSISGSVSTGARSSGIVGDVLRDIANGVVSKLVAGIYPIVIDSKNADGMVRLNYGEPVIEAGAIYNVYDASGFQVGQISATEVHGRYALGQILDDKVYNVTTGMVCRPAPTQRAAAAPVREIPW